MIQFWDKELYGHCYGKTLKRQLHCYETTTEYNRIDNCEKTIHCYKTIDYCFKTKDHCDQRSAD